MDAKDIALMAKIARREAAAIIPEKGDKGEDGKRGPAGRDGVNGTNGINGKDGRDGVDGRDGKDGRNGKDGKPGKNGATWHLLYEEPDDGYGHPGDFVLDGKSSNIYYKSGNEWEFIVHLKAEVPKLQMQPPAVISESRIESIIQRIAADKPEIKYTAVDYAVLLTDDVILADGALTVTLPNAVGNAGCLFRIKNIGTGDVNVEAVGGLIDGEVCQVLNQRYYAIDVVSDGTNWNIL